MWVLGAQFLCANPSADTNCVYHHGPGTDIFLASVSTSINGRRKILPWELYGLNESMYEALRMVPITLEYFKFLFIDFRESEEGMEEERERKKTVNLLFHLFMHSLVASCMCPHLGSNLQPWRIRIMF